MAIGGSRIASRSMNKFLLDMNLSPTWLASFEEQGIEAIHWSQIGLATATDAEIMAYAREHDWTVFTHDLDFGAMLAVTEAVAPSVIQIRVQDVSPSALADRFFHIITQFEDEITQGALIIVDPKKQRVRLLPLKPKS